MAQFNIGSTPVSGGTLDTTRDNWSAVQLATNTFFLAFSQSSPNHVLGQVIVTNGTNTPTFGSVTVLNNVDINSIQASRLSDSQVYLSMNQGGTGVLHQVCSVSGTTITAGTETARGDDFNRNSAFHALQAMPGSSATEYRMIYSGSGEDIREATLDVSGTTINSFTSEILQDLGNEEPLWFAAYDIPNSTDFYLVWMSTGNSNWIRYNTSGTKLTTTDISNAINPNWSTPVVLADGKLLVFDEQGKYQIFDEGSSSATLGSYVRSPNAINGIRPHTAWVLGDDHIMLIEPSDNADTFQEYFASTFKFDGNNMLIQGNNGWTSLGTSINVESSSQDASNASARPPGWAISNALSAWFYQTNSPSVDWVIRLFQQP